MDWIEQANKMNQEWLAAQQKMLKEFVKTGNDAMSSATGGAQTSATNYAETVETTLDALADHMEAHLDIDALLSCALRQSSA